MLESVNPGTLLRGDMGALTKSNEVRSTHATQGVNHSDGIYIVIQKQFTEDMITETHQINVSIVETMHNGSNDKIISFTIIPINVKKQIHPAK